MFRFIAYGQVRGYSYHVSFADQQNERTTFIARSARTWPRPGAQVAPQQSLILPPGCWHDPHSFPGTQVDIHTLTGERFATRQRGTTVLVPLTRNPRSRRQLEVVPGELVSRQTDWSGAGYRDDRKQILRAGASDRPRGGPMIAGRGSRQPRPVRGGPAADSRRDVLGSRRPEAIYLGEKNAA
jgi:hypothetical protein